MLNEKHEEAIENKDDFNATNRARKNAKESFSHSMLLGAFEAMDQDNFGVVQ